MPRRVTRKVRLTGLYYHYTWAAWSRLARLLFKCEQSNTQTRARYETFLSVYGPLSLLILIAMWAWAMIFGFSLLQWSSTGTVTYTRNDLGFWSHFYFSATTFFTLGLGDVYPHSNMARLLAMIESGLGLGFLALIVAYLPALNQSFSRREQTISLLDARAGSPPNAMEMLRRHSRDRGLQELEQFLTMWEKWSSELLESHLSYPVLAYFRSQHDNQSWLAALTTILDLTSLIIAYVSGSCRNQAQLTFAMTRHAVADLSIVFYTPPRNPDRDRLSVADQNLFKIVLADVGFDVEANTEADTKLRALRHMYEPYVNTLADHLFLALPEWIGGSNQNDNWQTSSWDAVSSDMVRKRRRGRTSPHF